VDRGSLEREQNLEELRRIALAQQTQIEQLLAVLAKQSRDLDKLRGKPGDLELQLKMLQVLQQKAKETQVALANAEGTGSAPTPQPKPDRKAPAATGPTKQPKLPIVDQLFELDEPDRTCTSCGGGLQPWAGQFEESEMIDVVDVAYRIVKVKQQKYICRCGGCVETAIGPTRAISGSRYSLAFAVKVVLDKWLDHIPLERQVRIFERHDLDVSSSTLWDLANALAHRLERVNAALLEHVKAQPVIGLDQTSWPRLEANASKPWQMWCLTAPGVVVHRIRDDKSARTFAELVGDYRGTIVADALGTHEAGAREGPGIVLAGCWAHVFRRFEEAQADHAEAERALEWIGALYESDRAAVDDAERARLRQANALSVLEPFRDWLYSRAEDKHLSIGKAAAYTLGIWNRLTVFVGDPRVPLDNNATERAIRGPVVGRKNHYGSKSRRGTEVAATLYSILETLKLQGVAPGPYLIAAATAADRGETLLPWNFDGK